MNNVQLNITIPTYWKEELEAIAASRKNTTYIDLIREAINEKYSFNKSDPKYANDFSLFAQDHLKVLHYKDGIIPFAVEPFRKRFVDHIEANRYTIATKFRQGGFTTTLVLWGIWKCMYTEDQHIYYVSKTDREAEALSRMADLALAYMDNNTRPAMLSNNLHYRKFRNTKSSLSFGTPNAARGKMMTHLVVDEAAFIKNMDYVWKCLFPCFNTGGKAIVISTTNSLCWFNDIYQAALKGENAFSVFQSHYKECSYYQDENFCAEMRKNLGEKGWAQEIEQCVVV